MSMKQSGRTTKKNGWALDDYVHRQGRGGTLCSSENIASKIPWILVACTRFAHAGVYAMSDFIIVRTDDPLRYRDGILSFWKNCLPGTPPERFDWLRSGNPAGPTVWFLAFDKSTGELAGTTSLVRKQLFAGGTAVHAGIMGDFMVAERYRAFGPYLKLLRETTGSLSSLGLDCIYTMPNPASRMACLRVGMEKVKDLCCFAKPLAVRFYLEKGMPGVVATALSPFVSASLRLASRELLVSPRGVHEEPLQFDAAFDDLWRELRERADGLLGDRSTRYLTWRYLQNPLYRFRLLTCRERGASRLEGFALFTRFEANKIEVYDIIGLGDRVIERLIAKLVGIGRRERCQALYFRAQLSSHTLRIFRRYRFFNTNDAFELFYIGKTDIPLELWDFFSGDRNI